MSTAGKYKIVEKLGSGGMGTVFRGLVIGQAGFQRPIVIKQLHDTGDRTHVRMFVDEARRYALLDHENIGRIFDFEEVDGRLCIILEYVDGWTLTQLLERHAALRRRMPVELAVFVVSRVCRALQYVFEHSAIVHRDISPSNVMMTREGTVKLIDFGIATRSGTCDRTLTGKPAYMAPEMIVEMRADSRSDIFSLGVVLWELLTGERLFSADTTAGILGKVLSPTPVPSPRERNPEVPAAVEALAGRALERSPDARFASAAEMGVACEHFLYDKGYGPTNLTLKQYLLELFPGAAPRPTTDSDTAEVPAFPELDMELIPIDDGLPTAASAPSPERTSAVRRPRG
jgi:serine/threonine protein kinase